MKDYFSKDFKRLMYGLLDKSIQSRFTLDDVMKEPFFKRIDWTKMEEKIGMKPPIKPKALNKIKTSKADKLIMKDEL